MLPATSLGMDFFPRYFYHVNQHALSEPMLAHHLYGMLATFRSESEVAFFINVNESIAFHARNRLRNSWTTLPKPLSNSSTHGRDTFFF